MSLSKFKLIALLVNLNLKKIRPFLKVFQEFQERMKMIFLRKKGHRNRFYPVLGFVQLEMMNDHHIVQMTNQKKVSRIKFKEKEKDGSWF